MGKLLIVLGSLLAVAMVALVFPEGLGAVGLVAIVSALAVLAFRTYTDEKEFITNVFLIGLVLRLGFGIMVHIFELGSFFGNDAETYNRNGTALLDYWLGAIPATDQTLIRATSTILPGWGMSYLTAAIYLVLGKSIFTAQSFCAAVGAATAPMAYFCAQKIFNSKRVSKTSALLIAVFPSFIIWSSQLLKDGLIIFLLVTVMTMVLVLQEKFNYAALLFLILSLFGIVSLRFYIFYMVAIAVAVLAVAVAVIVLRRSWGSSLDPSVHPLSSAEDRPTPPARHSSVALAGPDAAAAECNRDGPAGHQEPTAAAPARPRLDVQDRRTLHSKPSRSMQGSRAAASVAARAPAFAAEALVAPKYAIKFA